MISFIRIKKKDSKKQVDILVKNGVITQAQADKMTKGQKDSDDKQKAAQKKNLDEMKKNTDNYYASVSKEQKRANDANTRLTKDHDAEIKKN
nr:hypothetical protein [Lactococcus lactis]